MELGAFSVSLTVKSLTASKGFYEKLGFAAAGGDSDQGWLILRNGDTTLGLFQGMFDHNILTFNPGWTATTEDADTFTDVREIQKKLLELGIELDDVADADTSGPAHISLRDPDGNAILIDQHR